MRFKISNKFVVSPHQTKEFSSVEFEEQSFDGALKYAQSLIGSFYPKTLVFDKTKEDVAVGHYFDVLGNHVLVQLTEVFTSGGSI